MALKRIPVEFIERKIYLIRGQKVVLDSDLAKMYQVATKVLNQAVSRHKDRFPLDFMFQLTSEEDEYLRSQSVTSSAGHGGRRRPPHAFTEHGVAMLSSVLKSKRAVQLNILIIRAFVRLREYLATHKDLARKLEDVEPLKTSTVRRSNRSTTTSSGCLTRLQSLRSGASDSSPSPGESK
jgi:hypothetical protein